MTPELRAALYAAFSSRTDDLIVAWIESDPTLETLSWEQLENLEDRALLYETAVFKFVLPRWLELLSHERAPVWDVDTWLLRYRLKGEKWRAWPNKQVEVLRRVFEEWRDQYLREGMMEEFAEFIAEIEDDAARYLDVWVRARPIEVAQWVWKSSWARPSPLRVWLVSPRVEQKLEHVFFANPTGQHAQLLSDVIQLVRSLRAFETQKGAA